MPKEKNAPKNNVEKFKSYLKTLKGKERQTVINLMKKIAKS